MDISATTKWGIRKSCISMRKITSCFPICDTTYTRHVMDENVRIIVVCHTFSSATRRVLVVSKIGRKEVILRIEMQHFRIHHFVVAEISIYLIASVFWCCFIRFFIHKTQNCAANYISSYWWQNKVMYMKLLRNHANNHLPFSNLPYDQYALRGGRQRRKNQHFPNVIARDATGIGRIQNLTKGGGASRRCARFLYTSHLGGMKIHILNCCRSLKNLMGCAKEPRRTTAVPTVVYTT